MNNTRGKVARNVADMLLSMRSDSRTVRELMDLTGSHRSSVMAWITALEDVGLVVKGARRKITGQGGTVAQTWRMP